MSLLYAKSIGELSALEDVLIAEKDACLISKDLWTKWVAEQVDELLLVNLIQDTIHHTLVVEGYHNQSDDSIYVPMSVFRDLTGNQVNVRVEKAMPPHATKILLQPLDNELYHCDLYRHICQIGTFLKKIQFLRYHVRSWVDLR
jgi:hypothetical protein